MVTLLYTYHYFNSLYPYPFTSFRCVNGKSGESRPVNHEKKSIADVPTLLDLDNLSHPFRPLRALVSPCSRSAANMVWPSVLGGYFYQCLCGDRLLYCMGHISILAR